MEVQKSYEQLKNDRIARINYALSQSIKGTGVAYSIDTKYLIVIAPDLCPIFKIPLTWSLRGRKNPQDNYPVIETIIPERGYVKGNVAWVSRKASKIKSGTTEVEIYAVADWVAQKRKEVINGGARPPGMDDPAFTYISRPSFTPVVNDEAARERGQY